MGTNRRIVQKRNDGRFEVKKLLFTRRLQYPIRKVKP
jgi:hypothetical protein